MNTLIRTEWLKLKKYRAFWWMAAIIICTYPGINYIFYSLYENIKGSDEMAAQIVKTLGNPFTFPEVWHSVAYFSSGFIFIPAIVVIMFITNEYTYRTHRQNIVDGWSRNQFMWSKVIDVFTVTLLITLVYILVSLAIGFVNAEGNVTGIWKNSKYILLFFLQTLCQLSIAFLIAFLFRKAFIALGAFIFYYILEFILVLVFKANKLDVISRFLPLEISDLMIPVPTFLGKINNNKGQYDKALTLVNEHIIYSIVLLFITWMVCFYINSKRDL